MIGDPALLVDGSAIPSRERSVIGIDVTCDGVWVGDFDRVLTVTDSFCRTMLAGGWRIRLVPVTDRDVAPLRDLARHLGSVEVLTQGNDLHRLLLCLEECTAFVGQRLHSVVLASVVGVPAVMLEYHPKCRDFQESVGQGDATLRTDRVTEGELVEQVRAAINDRDDRRRQLLAAIEDLRSRLLGHSDAVNARLERVLVVYAKAACRLLTSGYAAQEAQRLARMTALRFVRCTPIDFGTRLYGIGRENLRSVPDGRRRPPPYLRDNMPFLGGGRVSRERRVRPVGAGFS